MCVCLNLISVNELLKVKEELSRERDDLLAEVVKLRELNAEAQVKQQQQDQQQQDMFSKIQEACLQFTLYSYN